MSTRHDKGTLSHCEAIDAHTYGAIYRGRLSDSIAVRIYSLPSDRRLLSVWESLATRWMRVQHPNIIRCYGVHLLRGTHVMVVQSHDGGSFDELFHSTQKPLSHHTLLSYALQIARACHRLACDCNLADVLDLTSRDVVLCAEYDSSRDAVVVVPKLTHIGFSFMESLFRQQNERSKLMNTNTAHLDISWDRAGFRIDSVGRFVDMVCEAWRKNYIRQYSQLPCMNHDRTCCHYHYRGEELSKEALAWVELPTPLQHLYEASRTTKESLPLSWSTVLHVLEKWKQNEDANTFLFKHCLDDGEHLSTRPSVLIELLVEVKADPYIIDCISQDCITPSEFCALSADDFKREFPGARPFQIVKLLRVQKKVQELLVHERMRALEEKFPVPTIPPPSLRRKAKGGESNSKDSACEDDGENVEKNTSIDVNITNKQSWCSFVSPSQQEKAEACWGLQLDLDCFENASSSLLITESSHKRNESLASLESLSLAKQPFCANPPSEHPAKEIVKAHGQESSIFASSTMGLEIDNEQMGAVWASMSRPSFLPESSTPTIFQNTGSLSPRGQEMLRATTVDLIEGLSDLCNGRMDLGICRIRAAAEVGNIAAAIKLAHLTMEGIGVEANPMEAMRWFSKAAQHASVMSADAQCLLDSDSAGVTSKQTRPFATISPADISCSAYENFCAAMDAYDADVFVRAHSLFMLSLCKDGDFICSILALQMLYLRSARDLPIPRTNDAIQQLHEACMTSAEDRQQECFDMLMKRATSTHATSTDAAMCGFAFYHGCGVAVDRTRAADFFHQAARQGSVDGFYGLALCQNHLSEVDLLGRSALIESLTQAAVGGHSDAQYRLGLIYADGLLVSRDIELSAKWYSRASIQGHAAAAGLLGACYEMGCGVKKDLNEAARLYRLQILFGNKDGTRQLSRMASPTSNPTVIL